MLATAVPALARSESPRVVVESWREPIERAEGVSLRLHARATDGLLAVGHAYLLIGQIAIAVATERGDTTARERIAALQTEAEDTRRTR